MTMIDKAEAHDDDLIRRRDALEILSDEGWLGHSRKRLDALPARGVGVRKLEWTAREDGLQFYAKQHASGSLYFYYTVLFSEHTGEWSALLDGVWHGGFPDADAAKAAAQADYEARILAALSPAAQPGANVAVQAREAAMQELIDAYQDIIDYGPLVLAKKDQWARVKAAKEKLKEDRT